MNQRILRRLEWLFWWIGIPLLVGCFSYLPFFLLRCVLVPVVGESCMRVPVVSQLVFDLHAYLEFIGQIFSGSGGIHLKWIEWMIKSFQSIFPSASVVELWLILRWVFGILTWWLLPGFLSLFFDASKRSRRFISSLLWIAIFLPLGFRPGVFSWFLPFGLLAFLGAVNAWKALREQRLTPALVWTMVAIGLSVVYDWFLLFTVIWTVVIWFSWFIRRSSVRVSVFGWLALSSFGLTSSLALANVFMEKFEVLFETLLRNGMAFTRLIQISGMLLAALCGLVMTWIAARRSDAQDTHAFELLYLSWVVTIVGWCSMLATGMYLHNDHFRIYVLLFAWTGAFMGLYKRPEVQSYSRRDRLMLACVLAVSALFSLSIVFRPFAFDGDQLNVIHLFVWLSLAFTSSCLLFSIRRLNIRAVVGIAVCCLVIGTLPYGLMFKQEKAQLSEMRVFEPGLAWIRRSVPSQDALCVDPEIVDPIASFSGHETFFTMQNIYSSGSDADLYVRLAALASLTDASTTSTKDAWTEWLVSRGTACYQYGVYKRLLEPVMGLKRFNDLSGCPQKTMDAETNFVIQLSRRFRKSDPRSSSLCKWIVFPSDAESRWDMTAYRLRYEDRRMKIAEVK